MSLYENRLWLKSYDPGVAHDVEVPDEPVRCFFKKNVEKFPDKTYLLFNETSLSYAEVNGLACRLANALETLGGKKGDRIALLMPNIPEHVVAIQAGYKAGTVNVGLNPLYTVAELKQQINDSGARTIIVYSRLVKKALELQQDEECTLKTVIVATPRGEAKVTEGNDLFDFYNLVEKAACEEPGVDLSGDDMAMLQYTGGTTGVSKACVLTNRNIMAMCRQHGTWMGQACPPEEMRNLCVIPLFHVFGWNTNVNMTLLGGGTIILVPKPDPDLVLHNINRHLPTVWATIPRFVREFMDHPRVADSKIGGLKGLLCGGAPLSDQDVERFKALTDAAVIEGYGSSETTNILTLNPVGHPKPGSVGLPLPGTVLKIVDVETGRMEMPAGESGEIVARGPQVMGEYWNNPEETEAAFTDEGYLYTGDIGYMDDEGFFFIVDRKKDLIIRSGFNVYPREIDEVIYQMPSIQESCTVGVPHDITGETVKVFVVLKPGTRLTVYQIREFCRRNLAAYKVPEFVEFVDEIPKTGIGKFDRNALRVRPGVKSVFL